jgi:hypothetical protein
VIYVESVWLTALQALAFYFNFPSTLMAACAACDTGLPDFNFAARKINIPSVTTPR